MDFAALPDGRNARYPRSPAYAGRHTGEFGNMAGARSIYVHHGKSTSSMPMDRLAADVDHSAAVPAAGADHRQADYFLGLLAESCREIDRRIEEYQKAITIAETSGAVDDAGGIRYLMRTEERERQTLQGLIGRLQERFVGRAPDEVPVRSRL